MILFTLIILIIIGALSGGWLHAFAVAFDMFIQALVWDSATGVTISSRAGLAARNGKPLGSKIVNFIMGSNTHCEDAIQADIDRAKNALKILGD